MQNNQYKNTTKNLGVQDFHLMTLVLQHYFDDPYFEQLKTRYPEKDIDQAEYVCVKLKYIVGGINVIKTLSGNIFFNITGSTSISSLGELFIRNHSEYLDQF